MIPNLFGLNSHCHVWSLGEDSTEENNSRPNSASASDNGNKYDNFALPYPTYTSFITSKTKVAFSFATPSPYSTVLVYDLFTKGYCTFSIPGNKVFMTFSSANSGHVTPTQIITVHLHGYGFPTDYHTGLKLLDAGLIGYRNMYCDAWLDVVRYDLYENMDSMDMKPRRLDQLVHIPFGHEWVLDPLSRRKDHNLVKFNDRAIVYVAHHLSSLTADRKNHVADQDPLTPLFFIFYDRCRDRIALRLRDPQPPASNSFHLEGFTNPFTLKASRYLSRLICSTIS